MATIIDVANAAGVSVATVSRVLNSTQNVKPKTREAVQRAIEELHYTSNVAARNLRTQESRVIIALARSFTNPFYSQVLSGICDVLNPRGYHVFMCKNSGEIKQTLNYIKMLDTGQADGMILMNCTDEDVWLRSYVGKYPIVQICEYSTHFALPKVTIDHEKNGYEATRHLIDLGHRQIAFLGAKNHHASTLGRFAGFYRAMSEAGLDTMWKVESDGDYNFELGKRCVTELLTQPKAQRPTAIFCISDTLALSAILAASELKMSVPDDLSVIGCDDIDYTTMSHPFLSTIHIPCPELGKNGAQMLLRYMSNLTERPDDILLDTHLVLRESCAPFSLH